MTDPAPTPRNPATSDTDLSGTYIPRSDSTFVGDYELLEEVARGGMGVVYKARQVSLDRIVALKLILSGEDASQDELSRFLAEGQSAARLDHPGIVPVYGCGELEGQPYLSMGFVNGPSLSRRLADKGPLPPREAAALLLQVAEAIDSAHRRNVVHRDLKPGNVLIDEDGRARVTDFGLAKRQDAGHSLTATGQLLGTPAYMSPEQAQGDEAGPSSDIYSLGATLYAALTGQPPFTATSVPEVLLQVTEDRPVPPSQHSPTVPAALDAICLKCLEKKSEDRYPTAEALAVELREFLAGGLEARKAAETRRRRLVLTAATAGTLLVVGLVTVITNSVLHSQAEARRQLAAELSPLSQRADAAVKLPVGTPHEAQLAVEEWEQLTKSLETLQQTHRIKGDGGIMQLETRLREGRTTAQTKFESFRAEIELEQDLNAALNSLWSEDDPELQYLACGEAVEAAFQRQTLEIIKLGPDELRQQLKSRSNTFRQLAARGLLLAEISATGAKQADRASHLNELQSARDLPAWQYSWRLTRTDGGLSAVLQVAELAISQAKSDELDLMALNIHVLYDHSLVPERLAMLQKLATQQPNPLVDRLITLYYDEKNRDRKAAEWVLSRGGSVTVMTKDKDWLDQRVTRVAELPAGSFRVTAVSLRDCAIEDGDLTSLVALPDLRHLFLDRTGVTDTGLRALVARSPRLHTLNLNGTRVTKDILDSLTSLSVISLRGLNIDQADLAAFATAHPEIEVLPNPALSTDPQSIDGAKSSFAMRFDGASRVELPLTRDAGFTTTIECWVQVPVEIFTAPSFPLNGFQGSSDGKPRVLAMNFAGRDRFRGESRNASGGIEATFPSARLPMERWTHVAVTCDGGELRTHQNGKRLGSLLMAPPTDGTALNFAIGAGPGVFWPYVGLVDEVRISSIGRYSDDFNPLRRFEPDEHTLALYHFDEGKSDRVLDSSGNGHDGTLIGTAKWVPESEIDE